MNISRIDSEEEYPLSVRINISSIDCRGENRNYIYQLLDRISKREYLSLVRMNISRIDSEGKVGFTTTGYWAENRKEKKIRHPSR